MLIDNNNFTNEQDERNNPDGPEQTYIRSTKQNSQELPMNEQQYAKELKEIKSRLMTLSGMLVSLMSSTSQANRKFESYLKCLSKQQAEMRQDINFIRAYMEIDKEWNEGD